MKYLSLLLSLLLFSCIKVGSNDLTLHDLDQALATKESSRQHAGFWEAMKDFNFDYTAQYPDSSEHKQFAEALQLILSGAYATAETNLEQIVESSSDSLLIHNAGVLLTGIYMLSYNWEDMIELDARLPNGIDDMSTISMVKSWNEQAREKIHYPEKSLTLPMKKSISGVPMIEVLVNGVQQTFWIDTGAEFTVLSSDIAKACGVNPLTTESSKVGTATDKRINLWPSVIHELRIGDIVFENHPVFIIGKEDLEFRLFKIFKILKIDGILGWNAIQNLRLEINPVENTVLFEKPVKQDHGKRNFHFLTQPFVSIQDTAGRTLEFFLDTGANRTSLYSPAFAYFDTSNAGKSTAMVGGAGGSQKVKQLELYNQSLVIGKTRIDFPEIQASSPMGDTEEDFIAYDGILGSDISSGALLILDFQNGWFELKRIRSYN